MQAVAAVCILEVWRRSKISAAISCPYCRQKVTDIFSYLSEKEENTKEFREVELRSRILEEAARYKANIKEEWIIEHKTKFMYRCAIMLMMLMFMCIYSLFSNIFTGIPSILSINLKLQFYVDFLLFMFCFSVSLVVISFYVLLYLFFFAGSSRYCAILELLLFMMHVYVTIWLWIMIDNVIPKLPNT